MHMKRESDLGHGSCVEEMESDEGNDLSLLLEVAESLCNLSQHMMTPGTSGGKAAYKPSAAKRKPRETQDQKASLLPPSKGATPRSNNTPNLAMLLPEGLQDSMALHLTTKAHPASMGGVVECETATAEAGSSVSTQNHKASALKRRRSQQKVARAAGDSEPHYCSSDTAEQEDVAGRILHEAREASPKLAVAGAAQQVVKRRRSAGSDITAHADEQSSPGSADRRQQQQQQQLLQGCMTTAGLGLPTGVQQIVEAPYGHHQVLCTLPAPAVQPAIIPVVSHHPSSSYREAAEDGGLSGMQHLPPFSNLPLQLGGNVMKGSILAMTPDGTLLLIPQQQQRNANEVRFVQQPGTNMAGGQQMRAIPLEEYQRLVMQQQQQQQQLYVPEEGGLHHARAGDSGTAAFYLGQQSHAAPAVSLPHQQLPVLVVPGPTQTTKLQQQQQKTHMLQPGVASLTGKASLPPGSSQRQAAVSPTSSQAAQGPVLLLRQQQQLPAGPQAHSAAALDMQQAAKYAAVQQLRSLHEAVAQHGSRLRRHTDDHEAVVAESHSQQQRQQLTQQDRQELVLLQALAQQKQELQEQHYRWQQLEEEQQWQEQQQEKQAQERRLALREELMRYQEVQEEHKRQQAQQLLEIITQQQQQQRQHVEQQQQQDADWEWEGAKAQQREHAAMQPSLLLKLPAAASQHAIEEQRVDVVHGQVQMLQRLASMHAQERQHQGDIVHAQVLQQLAARQQEQDSYDQQRSLAARQWREQQQQQEAQGAGQVQAHLVQQLAAWHQQRQQKQAAEATSHGQLQEAAARQRSQEEGGQRQGSILGILKVNQDEQQKRQAALLRMRQQEEQMLLHIMKQRVR